MPDPQDGNLPRTLYEDVMDHIIGLSMSGGPSDEEFKRAPEYEKLVRETEQSLTLAQVSKLPESYDRLLKALAVLAFQPGGVRNYSNNWEVDNDDENVTDDEDGDDLS